MLSLQWRRPDASEWARVVSPLSAYAPMSHTAQLPQQQVHVQLTCDKMSSLVTSVLCTLRALNKKHVIKNNLVFDVGYR